MDEFLRRLGEPTPAPGGGAASAAVAIIANSLVSMVAGLSINKKGNEKNAEMISEIIRSIPLRRSELDSLMKLDEEAFQEIVKAWRLPKDTPENLKLRSEKIEAAAKKAIEVPWKIASVSASILDDAVMLARYGLRSAITDSGCAGEFARSSIYGVIQNIRINLLSVHDKEYVENQMLKIKLFTQDVEEMYKEMNNEIETYLSKQRSKNA
ncbi:MAG: cyclodeaminase/cyclohydrolase family protein [Thermoplasmataceae archaeon]